MPFQRQLDPQEIHDTTGDAVEDAPKLPYGRGRAAFMRTSTHLFFVRILAVRPLAFPSATPDHSMMQVHLFAETGIIF